MHRRKRLSDDEIVQRVESLDAASTTLLVTSLVECLYGDESDEDWIGTLDAVADLLNHHGLAPEEHHGCAATRAACQPEGDHPNETPCSCACHNEE